MKRQDVARPSDTHANMDDILRHVRESWPALSHEDRQQIRWVKRMARDRRNALLVARFAHLPHGTMSVPRWFAMAVYHLKGWRFSPAQLQ